MNANIAITIAIRIGKVKNPDIINIIIFISNLVIYSSIVRNHRQITNKYDLLLSKLKNQVIFSEIELTNLSIV